ncbi:hypothetical protein [Streptomyces sp. x-80]|jgi:hypothetical protein|uniref:hypothetical protein n=1 Tax=Streptomyces sp. x-80 TaxID=2789282 RepID=UPI00398158BF
MRRYTFKRATAMLAAGTALAGVAGLASATSAAAGGNNLCSEQNYDVPSACVGWEADGSLRAFGLTDYADNSCRVDVVLKDMTTNVTWTRSEGCGDGQPDTEGRGTGNYHAGPSLPNPTHGHVYRGELRVTWNGGASYVTTASPSLNY